MKSCHLSRHWKCRAQKARARLRGWGRHFWARGYFCATVGEMTEEMIKEYLEHHFESDPATEFKVEP
nr:transposase [Methylomicrobium agile]